MSTPTPGFNEHSKELLRNLAALTRYRADTEREIIARLESEERRFRELADESRSAAETRYLTDKKSAENDLKKRTQALNQRYKDAMEPAERATAAEMQAFQARTNAFESGAKKKLEESLWLADTLVESGEGKARQEFESVRKQLDARSAELDDVTKQADGLLANVKAGPLSLFESGTNHNGLANAVPEDPEGFFAQGMPTPDAAKQLALAELWQLHQTLRPAWLRGPVIAGLSLVAAIAGGTVRGLVIAGPTVQNVAVTTVAAGVAGVGILALVRMLNRRRVPAAKRRMERAMFAARHAIEVAMSAAEERRTAVAGALQERRVQEIAKARTEAARASDDVRRRRSVEEPELKARHDLALSEIRQKFDNELWDLRDKAQQRVLQIETARTTSFAQAENQYSESVRDLEAREEAARATLESTWRDGLARAFTSMRDINAAAHAAAPSWGDVFWQQFQPRTLVPSFIPIGRIEGDLRSMPGGLSGDPRFGLPTVGNAVAHPEFDLPLCLDLLDKGSLLLETGTQGRTQGLAILNNVMLRLLTAFPPAKVRFTLIDPVGLGQSFAGFMHLADYDEALVSDKIWTDARHIEQKLTDLTEHMETVIQKYLRNQYASIQDYNEQAGEIAEPYRFLVIADLPTNFTESAARRLASIVTSGARCGVYTLVLADIRQRPPAWVPMADLERGSVTLQWKNDRFTVLDETLAPWPLVVEQPPDDAFSSRVIHEVGTRAKDAGKVQVPFGVVAPPPGKLWSMDSSQEVSVPLGRAGATKLQYLSLGRGTAQHALIAGRTGSGKSTLLHVIISNLALWYSPSEIEMYLVDFKKGVEFKTYATHQLPHARVIAVESEREFGISVLRKLDQELTRRGQLYRDSGVQDLAGFRKLGNVMPRILLLVDEFQEFFVEDDKIAAEASLLLDRLVRQGRAFGMHVVLGSQTLGGAYSLARSTLGQMGVRIALQCSEADSYLIMSEDNTAPRLLSRPGEAIYNDQSGLVEGNSPFQIVWLADSVRDERLDEVEAAAATMVARGGPQPTAPIVFEGNVPADISRTPRELAAVIAQGPTPKAAMAPTVWLGDAVSIKEPTSFTFARQSGSNLLIVGQQDEPAAALTLAATLCLLAHAPAGPSPTIHLLDSTPADAETAGLLPSLASKLPGRAKSYTPRQTPELLTLLLEELTRRERAAQQDAGDEVFPTSILLIQGLHRLRDLRRPADDYGFNSSDAPANPSQQLAKLLKEGPPLGMHVAIWCDTLANLERCLDRNGIREFDARVLFQMSQADSTHLIDGPQASTLGRNRAIYYREDLGVLEKFRPYSLPRAEWLDEQITKIGSRAT